LCTAVCTKMSKMGSFVAIVELPNKGVR